MRNRANFGSSFKCEVPSQASWLASPRSLLASNFILRTSNSAEGRSCQTNPILAAMPIRRSAFPGGQSCQTKPISPKRWEGASIVWEKSYSKSDRPGASAKQSQFRPVWQRARAGSGGCTNKANLGRSFYFKVSSVKYQAEQAGRRALGVFLLQTSHFTLQNSAEGRSCETKPISAGALWWPVWRFKPWSAPV